MEKYRQFSDEKNALNPFVPLWSSYRMSIGRWALQILGCPIVLVRVLLFLISFLYLLLVSALVYPFKLVAPIQVLLQRLLFPIGCRLALFACGFLQIRHDPADHRRLKIRPGPPLHVPRVGASEVIVANFQSCMDVLYLGYFGINQFVFVTKQGHYARPMTLIRAFFAAGAVGGVDDQLRAAQDFPSTSGTVAVFPEGVRTIGVAILPFAAATPATTLCGIQYSSHGPYTAHHTTGTSVSNHVASMMWNWTYVQEVSGTWLPREAIKSALAEHRSDKNTFVRTLLSRLVHRSVEVDGEWVTRHADFVEYWRGTRQGGYGKKNR